MFRRILMMFLAVRAFLMISNRRNHRFAGTGGWGSRHASGISRFNRGGGSDAWLADRRRRQFPWF